MRADGVGTNRRWTFRQRLSLRASTMLLLALPVLGLGDQVLKAVGAMAAAQWFGSAGSMAWALGGIAAVLALAALVASFVQQRPRLQFAIELALAPGAFATLGRY